ncbi:hypothetical protein TNCT_328841 [Trichonephila clavata]|uniref:Uncharacterized protein n=1 Tax=Trichonephila clavata TaxID=2740835 RepID=A0A8X6LMH0_TRICU|nr:hypothetical protein TNCT_328841 [Trichonephila clavata]
MIRGKKGNGRIFKVFFWWLPRGSSSNREYPVSEKTIHAMERRLANLIGLWQTGTSPIAPNRFEESGGPLNTCATLRMGGVEL